MVLEIPEPRRISLHDVDEEIRLELIHAIRQLKDRNRVMKELEAVLVDSIDLPADMLEGLLGDRP